MRVDDTTPELGSAWTPNHWPVATLIPSMTHSTKSAPTNTAPRG